MDQSNTSSQSYISIDELQVAYSGSSRSVSESPLPGILTHRDRFAMSSSSRRENFKKFMCLSNVKELREQIREDPDQFYNDEIEDLDAAALPIYLQDSQSRSSAGVNTVELDENLLNAYETFDVRKKRKVSETSLIPKYEDALQLRPLTEFKVDDYDMMRYKNNLAECFGKLLFIASESKVLVFQNDVKIDSTDLAPDFTSRRDRAAANWSMFPHTINYIKVSKLQGRDVLSCAVDDGRVVIYDIADFFINKTQRKARYELRLSSSVWGIDTQENKITVSDNSQTVTLFYIKDGRIYHHSSPQLIHNIPDVSFVESGEENVAFVACVSVSGEFMTFKFTITANEDIDGESEEQEPRDDYLIKADTVELYLHLQKYEIACAVINRVLISEDVWIVQYVNDHHFKEVDTLKDLGSKEDINMEMVLKKSKALNLTSNHLLTSDLGAGAWYEEISIGASNELTSELDPSNNENNLNKFTDKFARIQKSYDRIPEDQFSAAIPTSKDHDKFLFVATATRIGLYRFNELVCNVSSDKIFEIPFLREEIEFSNRLSLTRFIPELSAFLVVSQSGYISVMRLVKCCGLHSLRHEKIIPKMANAFTEVIVGIAIREMDDHSFWVYCVYSDGRVSVIDLSEPDETETLCIF